MQIARGAAQKKPFEGKYAELSEKIIKVFYQVHTELGYGLNFGKSAIFKRKVFDNDRKGSLHWTTK